MCQAHLCYNFMRHSVSEQEVNNLVQQNANDGVILTTRCLVHIPNLSSHHPTLYQCHAITLTVTNPHFLDTVILIDSTSGFFTETRLPPDDYIACTIEHDHTAVDTRYSAGVCTKFPPPVYSLTAHEVAAITHTK